MPIWFDVNNPGTEGKRSHILYQLLHHVRADQREAVKFIEQKRHWRNGLSSRDSEELVRRIANTDKILSLMNDWIKAKPGDWPK